jgi:phage regulator Rha-like protein
MVSEVELWEDVARAGSYLLAQGLDREHDNVRKLIEKYREDFEDFSDLKRRKLRSTGGRAANEYMLDEDQFMFLGTLLRNNKKVVAFKKAIIKQFKKCRLENEALQKHKQSPKYQVTRDAGKLVRKKTTDAMEEFKQYAISQGSKSPDMYFMLITKMMNGLLFIVEGKFKNLREVMTTQQLMTVSSAEQIIDRGIRDGMSRNKYYKDIYKDLTSRVRLFAELHGQSSVIDNCLMIEPKTGETK